MTRRIRTPQTADREIPYERRCVLEWLLLFVLGLPRAGAGRRRRAPTRDWVSLFNGKDLTGWKNYGAGEMGGR